MDSLPRVTNVSFCKQSISPIVHSSETMCKAIMHVVRGIMIQQRGKLIRVDINPIPIEREYGSV